eukprot:scaffold547_cov384-Prasinococcus_capsulatus_cf.AAC.47
MADAALALLNAGVWGKLIRSWLDELLPDSPRAIEQAKGKLHILVLVQKYPVPIVGLKRECFSEYHSKEDLIECLMASVHIPYFIDGCFYNKFRGASCVDGSPMLRKEVWQRGLGSPAFSVLFLGGAGVSLASW